MFRRIAIYGLIAGGFEGAMLVASTVWLNHYLPLAYDYVIGYTTMLIALSAIFVAIKRQRDEAGGGVIGFLPAFGMGLAISVIAGIFYVAAWETTLAVTHTDFIGGYAKLVIADAKAKGASAAKLAKLASEMEAARKQYADPLYRIPETFLEIFPVGVLVSLVSAGLLSFRRFLPARRV